MDVEKIEKNLELAIRAMTESWDAEKCISFIEIALDEHDRKKIGYYMLINELLDNLTFQTKNGFQTSKLRKQYVLLFDFLARRFANIQRFPAESSNNEEAIMVNEICCNVFNRVKYFIEVFLNANGSMGAFGLVPALIANNNLKKSFKDAYLTIAHSSAFILRQYSLNDSTIINNIKVFENAKI